MLTIHTSHVANNGLCACSQANVVWMKLESLTIAGARAERKLLFDITSQNGSTIIITFRPANNTIHYPTSVLV